MAKCNYEHTSTNSPRLAQLFLKTKHASAVCLKCGISRPTLHKWVKRFEEFGETGVDRLGTLTRVLSFVGVATASF